MNNKNNLESLVNAIRGKMRARVARMDAQNNKNNNQNQQQGEDKKKATGLGTRLPYALCKDLGIDTTGMTPREAWDAYHDKTGKTHDEALAEKTGKKIFDEPKEEKQEQKKNTEQKSNAEKNKEKADGIRDSLIGMVKTDDDGYRHVPIDEKERGKKILDDAPENTEIEIGYFYVRKGKDGKWTDEYGYEADSERIVDRLSYFASRGSKEPKDLVRVHVPSMVPFSPDKVDEWYDGLGMRPPAVDDSMLEVFDSVGDGSIVWEPGTTSGGPCASLVYKKDGTWRTFGSGVWNRRRAPVYALRSAKRLRADSSVISLSDAERAPLAETGPETELDKKLKEKLTESAEASEKALRSMKPGDKIRVGFGDKAIEYERVKGGIKPSVGYSKADFGLVAESLADIATVPGVSVSVSTVERPKKTPLTAEEKAAAAERRAARKKYKEEATKPYEPSGEKYESPDSLEKFDNYVKRRDDDLKKSHLLSDSDTEELREGFKELFSTHEYGMRFDAKLMKKILDSHFKNQMETDTTHGWYSPSGRAKASRDLFGHDTKLTDDTRDYYEKYGFMPEDPIESLRGGDSAGHYGGALVTFRKDRVQSRTTYTCSDSLGYAGSHDSCPGRAGVDPGWEGATCGNPRKALEEFRAAKLEGRKPRVKDVSGWYLELQYHGRLTFDDVEALYLKKWDAQSFLTDDIKTRLKEKGVKIYVDGEGWIQ